jgi:hypothetical protein
MDILDRRDSSVLHESNSKYVDNTIQYCIDLINNTIANNKTNNKTNNNKTNNKTNNNKTNNIYANIFGSLKHINNNSAIYNKIDIIVNIYANCTIHPICTELKNYIIKYNLNLLDVVKIFKKYANIPIECKYIKSDKIKSLKKIQHKCNEMLFCYKKLTYKEQCMLNDLFIQEKICADNIKYNSIHCIYTNISYIPKINIIYPSALSIIDCTE